MQPEEDISKYYKLGIFYYNPDDSRVLVPKRYGWGWTFNFANYWSWLLMAIIVAMLIWRLVKR
jgi:uncharacterized membrane protein